MSELNSPRRASGGWIGGVVLGILLGLVSPYMLAVSPLIFLAPVLTARLYASRGVWAVCASCVVQLAVACVVFGAEFAAIACVLLIVPLIVTLWLLRLGGPSLADALRVSVPVWLLCAALSVALAYLAAGMSLADYVATLVKEQLELSLIHI